MPIGIESGTDGDCSAPDCHRGDHDCCHGYPDDQCVDCCCDEPAETWNGIGSEKESDRELKFWVYRL